MDLLLLKAHKRYKLMEKNWKRERERERAYRWTDILKNTPIFSNNPNLCRLCNMFPIQSLKNKYKRKDTVHLHYEGHYLHWESCRSYVGVSFEGCFIRVVFFFQVLQEKKKVTIYGLTSSCICSIDPRSIIPLDLIDK